MSLQNEFTEIQRYLDNIPGGVNVLFEAHYWGRFRLLTNVAEAFPDPQGLIPLAQSQSPPYDTWLLIDVEKEKIVLREGDKAETIIIASSIEEFFGEQAVFRKRLKKNTSPFVFDQRVSMTELLSPEKYIVTSIDDPEFFEEVEGYFELLRIVEILTQQDLQFTQVKGKQKGTKKSLQLSIGDRQWEIKLNKELFDNEVIHRLNEILVELGIKDYVLSTSINEEMRMVVMKLGEGEFEVLGRMGLLI